MTSTHFWDNIADVYAEKPVDNPAAFDRKTEETLARLTPTSKVVDVGCGTGSFALRLAPHVGSVAGIDFSREMIRHANAKMKNDDATNVKFYVGELADFDAEFPRASLDCICAYSLLHLVADRDALVAEFFARLKPGGVLVSSTVALGESAMPYRFILPVMKWIGKAPSVNVITKADVVRTFECAGFEPPVEPDVGAGPNTAFFIARKPAA